MLPCVGEMSLVWANCHSPLRHALAKYLYVYMCEQMCHGCAVGANGNSPYFDLFYFDLFYFDLSPFNSPFKYENAKIQKIMINANND